ncbi:hypothetical protein TIFTF001_017537 [Ficus carica]|uniref:Uncharacterized protein n=1 Tax=Ficus carica TaxID=3494 RepID=A0AA88DJ19_FICCA|nr:hypothetical protein TIFTF001_017537 [Ficus carica]
MSKSKLAATKRHTIQEKAWWRWRRSLWWSEGTEGGPELVVAFSVNEKAWWRWRRSLWWSEGTQGRPELMVVSGSSTASFRAAAAAAEVEAADLGRHFLGEGTRKNKKKKGKFSYFGF